MAPAPRSAGRLTPVPLRRERAPEPELALEPQPSPGLRRRRRLRPRVFAWATAGVALALLLPYLPLPDGLPRNDGVALFKHHCAACHRLDGAGVAGLVPPLAGSEWALAPAPVPTQILLRGIDGPLVVRDQFYDGRMPSFAQLDDETLAAILSAVRRRWGNQAPAIDRAEVARERAHTAGAPWRGGAELQTIWPRR